MSDYGLDKAALDRWITREPDYGIDDEAPEECPTCGSPNIEEHDPRPGEHTCRDCGEVIEEDG